MRSRTAATVAGTLAILIVACGEPPQGLDPTQVLALGKGRAAACPTPADYVVTDQEEFIAAVDAASPGEVVGIDGMIALTHGIHIWVEGQTITCATPGSGFTVSPGSGFDFLLYVRGPNITLEHLVLDASATGRGPVYAWYTEINWWAEDIRFANNSVICGPGECFFSSGVSGVQVVDNYFESYGSISGIHLQRYVRTSDGAVFDPDDSRIERNTVVAKAPSIADPDWAFGGIRVRDGSGILVSKNKVSGPWANGLHITNLHDSQIRSNQFQGARYDGISTLPYYPEDPWSDGNVIRNNRISGSAEAGILAGFTCGNTLFGNNLNGNAGNIGIWFLEESGANTFAGNKNVVIDDGDWDCDDGGVDPNIITGRGAVIHGVQFGKVISAAASSDLR